MREETSDQSESLRPVVSPEVSPPMFSAEPLHITNPPKAISHQRIVWQAKSHALVEVLLVRGLEGRLLPSVETVLEHDLGRAARSEVERRL